MINIGIVGYGNLARGVEAAIRQNPDMCLKAVFTRRDPGALTIRTPGVPVVSTADAAQWTDRIDVMILCGGSATDLPQMTPAFVRMFNVVDSFDTHAKIPQHFAAVNAAAAETGHTAIISAGWDPGLFSVYRLYASAVLPQGKDYTFWGTGVSQGHSDAVRRIPGVIDCRQYTIPVPEAMERVRAGENPALTTREKHTRRKTQAEIIRQIMELKLTPEEGADRLEALGLDPTWATDANVAVMEKARRGDVESLRYLRDTIGEKPREGLEIGNLDGQPLSTIDLSTLTDEQLRAMIAAREAAEQG